MCPLGPAEAIVVVIPEITLLKSCLRLIARNVITGIIYFLGGDFKRNLPITCIKFEY